MTFFFTTSEGVSFVDGVLLHHIAVTRVWYTEVKEHRNLLIYDPLYSLMEYVNSVGNLEIYETTKALFIDRNPDIVVDKVAKVIEEHIKKQEGGIND